MNIQQYNSLQQEVIESEINTHLFLEGPFKSGKTSAATARLKHLADQSNPEHQILILTPQHTLSQAYQRCLLESDFPSGVIPTITTLAGLSRQFIRLFWSMISENSGFQARSASPTFLNMESAQFFMEQVCQPFLAKGYFLEVHINQARLFSQILDTMNKAALIGYPLEETAPRLTAAWNGEAIRVKHYQQSQECALAFRKFCLQNDVLDFSLQIEIFRNAILANSSLRQQFFKPYHYLIADNIEEDVPCLHDLLLELSDQIPSMLLIKDLHAGFRSFLGADPPSADRLRSICSQNFTFTEQFRVSSPMHAFQSAMTHCIMRKNSTDISPDALQAYTLQNVQFYPEMINSICDMVDHLVHEEQVPPGEIAILSPYLPDSLKFSLTTRLQSLSIPYLSTRPSRTLAEESVTNAVLVFAKHAHPQWEIPITSEELRSALMVLLPGCDIIRASLLAQNTLKANHHLEHFSTIPEFTRTRITYAMGNQFDVILDWIDQYQQSTQVPLDVFLSLLFGEVLSQPGFGLHNDIDNAVLLTRLIASIRDFRLTFQSLAEQQHIDSSQLFMETLQRGLLPASFYRDEPDLDTVTIAPAFTFLMKNKPVRYQFWLDIGDIGWWERLDQPLTHPYVLNRNWDPSKRWTDAQEYQANQSSLERLVRGLLDRCEEHVYLYVVRLNQAGINQSSPLLSGIQLFLKRTMGVKNHA
ncbi:MAG TPA: hypothetical protein DCK95_02070 [Anaerolineaceae bacterium]|uniref:UvrD-like helicase ATP-binding domain-containing protein n=1 Tax=Anaerolinea thermophila TaxID=167964 RepID=A0A101FZ83_9CHLR|nr:MAG: hypothetical protein XD73_0065 [Anaerolinea thermophila]HAF61093.1 hypothetical protein [Anaerolineaceae bacterium]